MTTDNVEKLADAIAREEGFYVPGSRPNRNNNPGDLRDWPDYPADPGGFTIFPTPQVGWDKLHVDLFHHARRYPDQSLREFIGGDGNGWTGYAPASDANDPAGYTAHIAAALGATPDTRFNQL